MQDHVWKTGRITLFDGHGKPVAEVARIARGWCWYVAGSDVGGDVETATEAMSAVEKALGIGLVKTPDITANFV